MCKKSDVAQVLAIFRATFPNFAPVDGAAAIWFELLKDVESETLLAAAQACAAEPGRAFAPSVGEIRGMIVRLAAMANKIPTAWEAWEMLLKSPMKRWHNCDVATDLRRRPTKSTHEYWALVAEIDVHTRACSDCGWRVDGKPMPEIVLTVARQLGYPDRFPGVENVETDRAHFIKAYERTVQMATQEAALPAGVRAFVESGQAGKAVKQLSEKLSGG